MHTKTSKQRQQRGTRPAFASMLVLATLCVAGSFAIGVETAGEMRAITPSEAGESIDGDMNGNGRLDREDVSIVLEVVRGYREPTTQELSADPNRDGRLTLDDAMRMLHDLSDL